MMLLIEGPIIKYSEIHPSRFEIMLHVQTPVAFHDHQRYTAAIRFWDLQHLLEGCLYHALQRSHSCQYTLYSSSHIVAISLFLTCSNTKKYGEFSTFSLCRLEPRTLVGLLIVAHVTDEIEDALGRAEIDCQVMHSALSATFHVSEPIKYRGSAGFLHANLLISVSKGQYIPLCCTYLEEEFSLCRCEVLQFINDDVFVEVPVFLCNSRIALENRKSEEYLVIECVAMFLTHEP